jgi:hypothetical protein
MTNEEFAIELENSINRSKRTLLKKGIEYSGVIDRLENFKRAGATQNITPEAALLGMVSKQFVSLSDMVKDPLNFTIKQFDEKIGDIRNYMFLLDALLRERTGE